MLHIITYYFTKNSWRNASIRIKMIVSDKEKNKSIADKLQEDIEELRITAKVELIETSKEVLR